MVYRGFRTNANTSGLLMITNILLGFILLVLAFIALMIYAIGDRLDDKKD